MIFSCPNEPFPELISFIFQNPPATQVFGPYSAEDGMTFTDWVSSPYNVDGFRWVDMLAGPNALPPHTLSRMMRDGVRVRFGVCVYLTVIFIMWL